MAKQKWTAKTVYFPAFVLACFIVGWMIPTFYDWSGANQSYSTPAFDQMFWSLLAFGGLAWFVIPWLPFGDTDTDEALKEESPRESPPKRFQFNLRSLLVLTAVVAVLLALIANCFALFGVLIWVVMFVSAVRMIVKHLSWQWQLSALLACMYFPYVWAFASKSVKNQSVELLFGAIVLPSFVPAMFLGRMFHTRPMEIIWLWCLLLVAEVAIGFWLIRKAPKCTIAYFVLVMLMSIYGSLFLNMGSRI